MKNTRLLLVSAFLVIPTTSANASEELQSSYDALMSVYGRLMVFAEACDLETRHDIKYSVLRMLPDLDPVDTASDLDRAYAQEQRFSGSIECNLDHTKTLEGSFSMTLDHVSDLVAKAVQ